MCFQRDRRFNIGLINKSGVLWFVSESELLESVSFPLRVLLSFSPVRFPLSRVSHLIARVALMPAIPIPTRFNSQV